MSYLTSYVTSCFTSYVTSYVASYLTSYVMSDDLFSELSDKKRAQVLMLDEAKMADRLRILDIEEVS